MNLISSVVFISQNDQFPVFAPHTSTGCGQSLSSSNPPRPPPPLRGGGRQGWNCLSGDNWQNCRSLDKSRAPVRRSIGSVWSWSKPPANQTRCMSLSPTQWPHTGSSSYSAWRCPGWRLTPICRRPANTRNTDSESMTSQRFPNFWAS